MSIHESYYSNRFRDVVSFDAEGQTEKQVVFIEETVPLTPGVKILDMGCGYGRHAILLAKNGYSVSGYDLSTDYLEEAKGEARRQGVEVKFARVDMRHMTAAQEFDVVLSLATSLAFYDDQTNKDIFRRVRRALGEGGTFWFDQADIFSFVNLVSSHAKSGAKALSGGRKYRYTRIFDPHRCVVSHRAVIESEGGREESGWDLRYYTLPEVMQMAKEVGFRVVRTFGGYDSSPYCSESKRMIVVMEKS